MAYIRVGRCTDSTVTIYDNTKISQNLKKRKLVIMGNMGTVKQLDDIAIVGMRLRANL